MEIVARRNTHKWAIGPYDAELPPAGHPKPLPNRNWRTNHRYVDTSRSLVTLQGKKRHTAALQANPRISRPRVGLRAGFGQRRVPNFALISPSPFGPASRRADFREQRQIDESS